MFVLFNILDSEFELILQKNDKWYPKKNLDFR